MRIILLILAFLILICPEILKVYFIMPFPGSQVNDRIEIAYFLNQYIVYIRIVAIILFLIALFHAWERIALSGKIILGIFVAFYFFIFMLFNYYFVADKIFYQPTNRIFLTADSSSIDPKQLILGVAIGGESKAYPIEIIGYHHQVRDTVGGQPVMITYCTVCRTGRVFNPLVDNKAEEFRLVGMDHYNAMFEDQTTKSWWRQVNGEAIAGSLKGKMLEEIPSTQMTLKRWLEEYPDSKIMQPDTLYKLGYEDLKLYDEGKTPNGLETHDSLLWKRKSWVVGVQLSKVARAYDWNELLLSKVINDTLAKIPVAIVIENDSATFHVFRRDSLQFQYDPKTLSMVDRQTNSVWGLNGKCISGALIGNRLTTIQSYQEFWHSWKNFKPSTTTYELNPKKD